MKGRRTVKELESKKRQAKIQVYIMLGVSLVVAITELIYSLLGFSSIKLFSIVALGLAVCSIFYSDLNYYSLKLEMLKREISENR